ncbi:COX15/CtaA family protein [Candidatus Ichthyocystis hellenicum]|uniref:COX15/CtaA family protein n=1 Tax=Candidatus Ichthyocystis hellenicum TaxID=1561003 RepID=UPI000AF4082A|nr:COX15/CtaA family protein [Candidatus Ichthyocystis hellenicum]
MLSVAGIFLGSYVRLSNAGLGCPDWPGCYGHFWVPKTVNEVLSAEKRYGTAFFYGLASREMIHRYVVSLLGLLIVTMFFLTFFYSSIDKRLSRERSWVTCLLLLVISQGLFGMWTVTLKLWPIIVTTHLMGGILTFCLAIWMFCRVSNIHKGSTVSLPVRLLSITVLLMLALQILLGGWVSTNYAGLSCESLLRCNGKLVPNMNFALAFSLEPYPALMIIPPVAQVTVLWLHRLWAMFVTAGVLFLSVKLYMKRYILVSVAMTILVFLQIIFGISNIIFHLPKFVAVSHTVCAAMLLASLLIANYLIFYSSRDVSN